MGEELLCHRDAEVDGKMRNNTMMRFKIAGLLLILSLSATGSYSQSSPCELVPKSLLQEPRSEWKGHYVNEPYTYSLEIPERLTGYAEVPPAPLHGFGIPLGEAPQSYIYVGGEANAYDYEVPVDAALAHLRYMRQDNKAVESATISQSRLGRLPAVRMIITYSCPRSAVRYVQDSTFAIAPGKSPLYEVTLLSLTSRYERDRRVLDQILRSWKYTGN
jgi:hypothetical protein